MRSRKDAMAENDQKGSAVRKLVGLGLILVLVLGSLFVMQQLRHAAAIQDCVASGRRNCVPITSEH
jgi:cell division septal protein FtsQ